MLPSVHGSAYNNIVAGASKDSNLVHEPRDRTQHDGQSQFHSSLQLPSAVALQNLIDRMCFPALFSLSMLYTIDWELARGWDLSAESSFVDSVATVDLPSPP